MNQELSRILDGFMGQMQAEPGILGAWNFGSAMHGLSGEYSDVDIVFLVEKNSFEKTEQRVPALLAALCDQVLLCWEEEFNSECIVNNGYLLKKGEQVFSLMYFCWIRRIWMTLYAGFTTRICRKKMWYGIRMERYASSVGTVPRDSIGTAISTVCAAPTGITCICRPSIYGEGIILSCAVLCEPCLKSISPCC